MHIEKRDAIAFTQLLALDISQRSRTLLRSNRNVTGNQRVGNSLEAPLLKINIGAADSESSTSRRAESGSSSGVGSSRSSTGEFGQE